jgi:TonB family protein
MALVLKADQVVQGSPGEAYVDSGQVIIGRLPSNHLVIPGDQVEPIHAVVEVDEDTGECRLVDMASDEGVYLNGVKVEVVKVIKPGDSIRIGGVTISVLDRSQFESEDDAVPAVHLDAVDIAGGMEAPERHGFSRSHEEYGQRDHEDLAGASDPHRGIEVEAAGQGNDRLKNFKTQKRATVKSEGISGSGRSVGSSGRSSGSSGNAAAPRDKLFAPGKERPEGSTLEIVAFWENCILDIKHYGGRVKPGEEPRPDTIVLGNEENEHLIGVGPKANTRNYPLGKVSGGKAKISLNKEMKAKVRRSNSVEKIDGPASFELSSREMALIKHGPLHYYLKNVSLPNPALKKFQDADGKPIIFAYAFLLYALLVGGLLAMPPAAEKDMYDEELWAQVLTIRTPTPKPEAQLPAPKPVVKVEKPAVAPPPPPAKPAPVVAERKPAAAPPKVSSLQSPTPQPRPQQAAQTPAVSKGRSAVKDTGLGKKTAAKAPGDSSGERTGGKGNFAAQRKGTDASDKMGAEGGKKNVMSGINLSQLGAGIGKVSDTGGIGAIATNLKSQAGGAGAGSGSASRSSGFGGISSSSSLNTGGVGDVVKGLGGGAGGAGAGGLGDPNGRSGSAGKRITAQVVVVPQGDPAIEGALTKEEIEAVIKQNLAQIKACYERNLQGNRGLAGRVKTAFVIQPDGRVKSASIVSSDLSSTATEACITQAIRRWKFPLPRGGGVVNVNYPFVFAPR